MLCNWTGHWLKRHYTRIRKNYDDWWNLTDREFSKIKKKSKWIKCKCGVPEALKLTNVYWETQNKHSFIGVHAFPTNKYFWSMNSHLHNCGEKWVNPLFSHSQNNRSTRKKSFHLRKGEKKTSAWVFSPVYYHSAVKSRLKREWVVRTVVYKRILYLSKLQNDWEDSFILFRLIFHHFD